VSLHEHEILPGYLGAAVLESIEDILTETKSACTIIIIPEIIARTLVVYEQCDVAVWGSVGVSERLWDVIDLSKIHTAACTTTKIL